MSVPTPTLFDQMVVHCFWFPKCPTVIRDVDSQWAHDRMEAHYDEKHADDISRAIGRA